MFLEMLEQVAVFTVFALLFARISALRLIERKSGQRWFMRGFLFFGGLAILGTYLGVEVRGALANSRAIGAVLAGLFGGPGLGLAVGGVAGLHRYSLGGFTDVACGLSTMAEGLIGGTVHLWWRRRRGASREAVLEPGLAGAATFAAEFVQMLIILAVARPVGQAWGLVQVIGVPMIAMNSLGAWLFATVLLDQRRLRERLDDRSTRVALDVAENAVGALGEGLNHESAPRLAETLLRRLPLGAVAVTDRERVLGFAGLGSDHHKAGDPAGSVVVEIDAGQPRFIDRFQCRTGPDCPLHSALVVPLAIEEQTVGSLVLFEPRRGTFGDAQHAFGAGLARLLSEQLLRHRLEEQRKLLTSSELKLLQAQIHPHFLFNALNVIRSVIRSDPQRGRKLVGDLSDFMRTNLKRAARTVSFREELEHVRAYLELERARFGDRLRIDEYIDTDVGDILVPTFTLQPLVENAIRHGVKDLLEDGVVQIRAERRGQELFIEVEDNGGCFKEASKSLDGMGLSLVNRRIQLVFGEAYGVSVHCEPGDFTRVSIRIPVPVAASAPREEVQA